MNSKNRPKAPKNLWGIPDKVGLSSYFDSHEQRKGIAYLYQVSARNGSLKTSRLRFQTLQCEAAFNALKMLLCNCPPESPRTDLLFLLYRRNAGRLSELNIDRTYLQQKGSFENCR